jgi:required for meiotic nuclear division protein 1
MLPKIKIVAYQLGENIYLKNFKSSYIGSVYSSSSTEVFIKKGEYSYIYVQNYGEVAFSNCDESTIKEFINYIRQFVDSPVSLGKEYKEDFIIELIPEQTLKFEYNSIQVPEINADVIKIAMLNVSQSVVLDYYTEFSQALLLETSRFIQELEMRGKLSISKPNLMKFIGKTLRTQNRIIDNIYFLDAPDTVWDIEYLSKINDGLSSTFKLKTRFREVEYTLKIIENNLNTFSQLVQHRDSTKLEWIIIILILFEILQALYTTLH